MQLRLTERFSPATLYVSGGLGNALLSVMTAGHLGIKVNSVGWNMQHTADGNCLARFLTLPVGNSAQKRIEVPSWNKLYNLDNLVKYAHLYDSRLFRYINVDFIRSILLYKNVCALHLRLGDFKCYGPKYFLPNALYISDALLYLPASVDTIKVLTNGTNEEVDLLLKLSGCYDKYNVLLCSNDETRPDTVLIDMMQCGSLIKTGSTLSLSAFIFKQYDSLVYSVNNKNPKYTTEQVKIDLPGTHAIIVS